MKRLEDTRDGNNDWYFGVGSSAYSSAEQFYFIIEPDSDGDRDAAAAFWESIVGEGYQDKTDDEFVQGFAMGAIGIWYAVQDKI